MTSTKEHASDWPRIEPMPAKTRQAYRIRIDAQRAESLRREFDFPEDCDMAGLLAWPQSFLSFIRTAKPLTPAERRDMFASLRDHVAGARKLLAITEVRTVLLSSGFDPSVLFDVTEINRGLEGIQGFEDMLTCLELFASGQATLFSMLTTRGRQTQPVSVLRLVCAKTFLTIWQNHKGDPRSDRKATGRFYEFMGRAFAVIGHELEDDELRVVQRKLWRVW